MKENGGPAHCFSTFFLCIRTYFGDKICLYIKYISLAILIIVGGISRDEDAGDEQQFMSRSYPETPPGINKHNEMNDLI
jgi:hypothetical protein